MLTIVTVLCVALSLVTANPSGGYYQPKPMMASYSAPSTPAPAPAVYQQPIYYSTTPIAAYSAPTTTTSYNVVPTVAAYESKPMTYSAPPPPTVAYQTPSTTTTASSGYEVTTPYQQTTTYSTPAAVVPVYQTPTTAAPADVYQMTTTTQSYSTPTTAAYSAPKSSYKAPPSAPSYSKSY